ncbi:MAG: hypothetical protein Greene07147_391 [Parcubacteria group bacterium Greene0714_7]|nr:MAG: hypothetical protein Greene07147_391 [Parcubacteria group bacterium Greene0714_7]
MSELRMNNEGVVPEKRRMGPIEEEVLLMLQRSDEMRKSGRPFSYKIPFHRG